MESNTKIAIPGHGGLEQYFNLRRCPTHFPSLPGGGLMQFLELALYPVPHVTSQAPHGPQLSQPPSAVSTKHEHNA